MHQFISARSDMLTILCLLFWCSLYYDYQSPYVKVQHILPLHQQLHNKPTLLDRCDTVATLRNYWYQRVCMYTSTQTLPRPHGAVGSGRWITSCIRKLKLCKNTVISDLLSCLLVVSEHLWSWNQYGKI